MHFSLHDRRSSRDSKCGALSGGDLPQQQIRCKGLGVEQPPTSFSENSTRAKMARRTSLDNRAHLPTPFSENCSRAKMSRRTSIDNANLATVMNSGGGMPTVTPKSTRAKMDRRTSIDNASIVIVTNSGGGMPNATPKSIRAKMARRTSLDNANPVTVMNSGGGMPTVTPKSTRVVRRKSLCATQLVELCEVPFTSEGLLGPLQNSNSSSLHSRSKGVPPLSSNRQPSGRSHHERPEYKEVIASAKTSIGSSGRSSCKDTLHQDHKKKGARESGSLKDVNESIINTKDHVGQESNKKQTQKGSHKISADTPSDKDCVRQESKKKLPRQERDKIHTGPPHDNDLVGRESKKKLSGEGSEKMSTDPPSGTSVVGESKKKSKKKLLPHENEMTAQPEGEKLSSSKHRRSSNSKELPTGKEKKKRNELGPKASRQSSSEKPKEKSGRVRKVKKQESKPKSIKPKSLSSLDDTNSTCVDMTESDLSCLDMTESETTEWDDVFDYIQEVEPMFVAHLKGQHSRNQSSFHYDEVVENEEDMDMDFSLLMRDSLSSGRFPSIDEKSDYL